MIGLSVFLASVTAIPFLILSAEVMFGLRAPVSPILNNISPKTTVLIPAHDEANGIGAVVAQIANTGFDILVVADNCSDDTAINARTAGARVVERNEPNHGKGYALAFGRDVLSSDPPAVVIIMDADCFAHGDALARLANRAAQCGRVVQARYLLETRAEDGPTTRISNFAFALKNVVRQRGLMRIAGTCVLTGTGMAFPWDLFVEAPLATDDSVEDLSIGLALVRAGHLPIYANDALVTSAPASGTAALTQRTRWEHGFVATAQAQAPKMLLRLDWTSRWLGMHLLVPPLALLFALGLVALLVVGGLGTVSGFGPAIALATVIGIAASAVLGGWCAVGREIVPLAMLLRVPMYVFWKLPIYLKLTRGADRRWTRTERD